MYYNQELGLCIEFGPVRVDSVRRGGGPLAPPLDQIPLRRFTPSWTSTRVTCDCLLPFVHPLLSQVSDDTNTQTLHVCHICLHWSGFGGQLIGIYGSPRHVVSGICKPHPFPMFHTQFTQRTVFCAKTSATCSIPDLAWRLNSRDSPVLFCVSS